MNYLLDTNIISELRRNNPNVNLLNWFEQIDNNQLYLSVITIGEIRTGALKKAKTDQKTGDILMSWVNKLVQNYSEKIVDIDINTSEEWARLLTIDSTNPIDALIAAQAINFNLILVTRNIKHLEMFNVKLINPFN